MGRWPIGRAASRGDPSPAVANAFAIAATTREQVDAEGYDGDGTVTTMHFQQTNAADTDLGTVQFARIAEGFDIKTDLGRTLLMVML